MKLKKFQGYMSIITKAIASLLVLMLFVTGGLYGVSAITTKTVSSNQKTTYGEQAASNQLASAKTSVNDGSAGFKLTASGESETSLETLSASKVLEAPTQLKYDALSDTKLKLSWGKVDHATVYFIYRKPLEGSYKLIKKVHNNYWTDTVSSGQVYMYKVKAIDRTGTYQKSKASKTLMVFMPTKKISVNIVSKNKKAYLTWKAVPNADKYLVYKSTDGKSFKYYHSVTSPKYTDKEVTEGKVYYYKVRGCYTIYGQRHNGLISAVAKSRIYRIDTSKKLIALTFDDGPSKFTPKIVDILDKYNARATFFVVGNRVNDYKKELKYAYEHGNQIGNHTYDHTRLTDISLDKVKEELSKTNSVVKKVIGVEPTLIRAPYGRADDDILRVGGKPFMRWSLDTLDWKTRDETSNYNNVINNVKDGDIILMHDIHESTYNSINKIVNKLKKMGYELCTVSELAEIRGVKLENGKVYYSIRP